MEKQIDCSDEVLAVPSPYSMLSLSMSYLRVLCRKLRLIDSIQYLRMLFHFGPWRVLPIFIIRTVRRSKAVLTDGRPRFFGYDVLKVVSQLDTQSHYTAGLIPQDLLESVTRITSNLPSGEYVHVQNSINSVQRIVLNPDVQDVLHAYFGCVPELLEASIFVTGPSSKRHQQSTFHYDFAGWKSLNVFVYLTDTAQEDSHHIVIAGTHNHSLGEVLGVTMDEEDASERYGNAITPILGPAGTLFFENTEAFHRRNFTGTGRKRVLLNLLFASHRSLVSAGRSGVGKISRSNNIIQQCTLPE